MLLLSETMQQGVPNCKIIETYECPGYHSYFDACRGIQKETSTYSVTLEQKHWIYGA